MRQKHPEQRRWDRLRKPLMAVCALTFIMGLAILGASLWQNRNNKEDIDTDTQKGVIHESTAPVEQKVGEKEYVAKTNLSTYLFMGIDKDGKVEKVEEYGAAGQADTQILLVLDHDAKTWQILELNRDSYVDIPVLDMFGIFGGYTKAQLALAHSYGDGMEQSCKNAVTAVSMMLENQKIDGYAALNMGAIAPFTEALGGVEVTITTDFTHMDPTLVVGETINLKGQQAYIFLRTRKGVDDQTNLARMNRQNQFLEALEAKIPSVSDSQVLKCYDAVFDYMVTNLGSQTMVDISEYLKKYTKKETLTIQGKNEVDNNNFIRYILEESSLKEAILELFYCQK